MISILLVASIGVIALWLIATRPIRDARNPPGGAILDFEEDEPR
jgi:hypothetical protein